MRERRPLAVIDDAAMNALLGHEAERYASFLIENMRRHFGDIATLATH